MAFDFPSSPVVGQQFTPVAGVTYTWNGYGWVLSGGGGAGAVGGRLQYVSATALSFTPFNGGYTTINGAGLPIPAGGIVGLGNTGVYVNGVSGQNLAASTTYYVYEFNNSGIITGDFSTTGHTTSSTAGNVGTEIKSGDNTRSLIGMIRTNASALFVDTQTQRFVRSWFNRIRANLLGADVGGGTIGSTTWTELLSIVARVEWVNFSGDLITVSFLGSMSNNMTGNYCASNIGLDGTPSSPEHLGFSASGGFRVPFHTMITQNPAEGYHYAQTLGVVNAGTGTWHTSVVGGGASGCRLVGNIS